MTSKMKLFQFKFIKFYLVALLLCSISLLAQNSLSEILPAQIQVDSLKARLEGATGTERLMVLMDLVETLHDKDAKQAIMYGREAVSLFQENTENKLIRQIWYHKAKSGASSFRVRDWPAQQKTG